MMRAVANSEVEDGRATDFERLFREEGEALWRSLVAFTGGRSWIAEEAMAEAFARAIASSEEFRDPKAWIYRVAFRVAIDELRDEARRRRLVTDEPVEDPFASDDVWLSLLRLPRNQRVAVVMRYEMDLSVGEISRRMGIRPPTVRVHLFRGRRRLRELLEAKGIHHA